MLTPVHLLGDFNADGTVDAADYVVWRKIDGSQTDLDLWRAHFGESASSGAAAVGAVPEPAPLTSLFLVAAARYFRRGRRA